MFAKLPEPVICPAVMPLEIAHITQVREQGYGRFNHDEASIELSLIKQNKGLCAGDGICPGPSPRTHHGLWRLLGKQTLSCPIEDIATLEFQKRRSGY